MAKNTTIIDEMTASARGVVALLIGDKRAVGYFDFSQRGLAGSFIVMLFLVGFQAGMSMLVGGSPPSLSVYREVTILVAGVGSSMAATAMFLRQIGRLDRFAPYLTAHNWATFFMVVTATVLLLIGFPPSIILLALFAGGLTAHINIGRLLVELSPLQIFVLFVVQVIGVLIGLVVYGIILPLSPAEILAITGASSPPA